MRKLIKKILLEGRVEDMKKRYPEHGESVDYFIDGDPSGNNKYLQWMMKHHVKNDENMNIVLSVATSFHKKVQRLKKKDINQYKTVQELIDAILEIGKSKGDVEREIKRDGADTLYEDDNVVVIKPLNHEGSCKYGSGTKWCITMKSTDKYWEAYTKKTASFGGTNWYKPGEPIETIKRTWLDKLLGKPGEVIQRETQNFIKQFPIGIMYFIIYKRRVSKYTWDDELRARIPEYIKADPRDPFNKLALLYKPGRSDYGDLSWSKEYRDGNWLGMIGDKLDSAHNNLSIYNSLDQKVTLRDLSREFDDEFSLPFTHVEHDFQKERDAINIILKDVLDKVYPLPGDKDSKRPMSWITDRSGELQYVPSDNLRKVSKGSGVEWRNGRKYK